MLGGVALHSDQKWAVSSEAQKGMQPYSDHGILLHVKTKCTVAHRCTFYLFFLSVQELPFWLILDLFLT